MEPNSEPFSKILSLLAASGVIYKIHEHPPSITVQDADANLWFPVERLVKRIDANYRALGVIRKDAIIWF